MKSYNHVMLIGHLAANPELRKTKKGVSVTNFSIAVNRNSISENGEKSEIADFHRVVAWRKLGEMCAKFMKKGMPVLVQGKLVNDNYTDKNGTRKFSTGIIADEFRMLNSRRNPEGESQVSVDSVPGTDEEEEDSENVKKVKSKSVK